MDGGPTNLVNLHIAIYDTHPFKKNTVYKGRIQFLFFKSGQELLKIMKIYSMM